MYLECFMLNEESLNKFGVRNVLINILSKLKVVVELHDKDNFSVGI